MARLGLYVRLSHSYAVEAALFDSAEFGVLPCYAQCPHWYRGPIDGGATARDIATQSMSGNTDSRAQLFQHARNDLLHLTPDTRNGLVVLASEHPIDRRLRCLPTQVYDSSLDEFTERGVHITEGPRPTRCAAASFEMIDERRAHQFFETSLHPGRRPTTEQWIVHSVHNVPDVFCAIDHSRGHGPSRFICRISQRRRSRSLKRAIALSK